MGSNLLIQEAKAYTTQLTPIATKKDVAAATVNLEYPIQLQNGSGFRITISQWIPEGVVEIYAIGPKGETASIITKEQAIKVDNQGMATFDIPYAYKDFYEGTWILVVAGPSGIYQIQMPIPKK